MEHTELLALFDREQRREVVFPGYRREVTPDVVRMTPVKLPYDEGAVIWSDLSATDADAVIAEQVAYFGNLGYGFEWKTYSHDLPPDLPERLLRAGFEADELENVMVLDLVENPELLHGLSAADIREITDPGKIGQVIDVLTRVWGEDRNRLRAVLADEMVEAPDLLRIYVATVDGTPASAAWIRYHPDSQFASLWGGSTVAEHRGRGLYSALLSVRARDAHARGVRFLTVDASSMSRPILARFGFKLLATTRPYQWTPNHPG